MTTWWRAPHMLSTNCNSCTWNPQEMEGTWLILALELAIKCQSYIYIYTHTYIYIYKDSFCDSIGSLQALARKENAICCWSRELEAHSLYKDLGVSQKGWETHGNFSWGIVLYDCQNVEFSIFEGYIPNFWKCLDTPTLFVTKGSWPKMWAPPGRRIRFWRRRSETRANFFYPWWEKTA